MATFIKKSPVAVSLFDLETVMKNYFCAVQSNQKNENEAG